MEVNSGIRQAIGREMPLYAYISYFVDYLVKIGLWRLRKEKNKYVSISRSHNITASSESAPTLSLHCRDGKSIRAIRASNAANVLIFTWKAVKI